MAKSFHLLPGSQKSKHMSQEGLSCHKYIEPGRFLAEENLHNLLISCI